MIQNISIRNQKFFSSTPELNAAQAYKFLKIFSQTPNDWIIRSENHQFYASMITDKSFIKSINLTELVDLNVVNRSNIDEIAKRIFTNFDTKYYVNRSNSSDLIHQKIAYYYNAKGKLRISEEVAQATLKALSRNSWMIRFDQLDMPLFCTSIKQQDHQHYSEIPFDSSFKDENTFYSYLGFKPHHILSKREDFAPFFNYAKFEEILPFFRLHNLKTYAETIPKHVAFDRLGSKKIGSWILLKTECGYQVVQKLKTHFYIKEYDDLDISIMEIFCKSFNIEDRDLAPITQEEFNKNIFSISKEDAIAIVQHKKNDTWFLNKLVGKNGFILFIKTGSDSFKIKLYENDLSEDLIKEICERCGWANRFSNPETNL